jgi:hypothetical protein
MNNELKRIWKETVVAQIQALSHLTGRSEENHVKVGQASRSVSTRRLEHESAEYEANHWTVTFGGQNNCKMYKSALFHYVHILNIPG